MTDQANISYTLYEESKVTEGGTTYVLATVPSEGVRKLLISGDTDGFEGTDIGGVLACDLTAGNAAALRGRLPWLTPTPLGLATSAGFGDRLGIATPGHVAAVRGTGVAPIFAQQSVRENARVKRTPQQVMDDAMWGVFQTGWREAWGADADHLKEIADADAFINAGYTFFTIDPSDHVDDTAEADTIETLQAKVAALPWDDLHSSAEQMQQAFLRAFDLGELTLEYDEHILLKAAAKYGKAIAHTAHLARYLGEQLSGAFDLEMSVDETNTTTTLYEHFYIAGELRRLGVRLVSLAPRFVGRFEKGVDYIGDLGDLERNIAGHAAIMRYFGNSYKLSLHTGSDKFGVYPIAMQHTGGLVHLKTAGTSYLEALRTIARVNPPLFRQILELAHQRFENDRKTYHISAQLNNVPAAAELSDDALPALLDQFDARQVLHVTFGSAIDAYRSQILRTLAEHEHRYVDALKAHFDRHLAPFSRIN